MRSKNAAKNIIVYLVYEVFVFVLGIIFPRFIILSYGSEINGLTSTITRLLSLINLIQAGAVGAAIYQMYKPVAEKDYETQSSILYTSKKYFSKITRIYLGIALFAGIIYGFYLEGEQLSTIEIILSFVILAINGSFEFLFTAKTDILLSPHQKKYYVILSSIINQIARYALTIIVLVLHMHFLFLYLAILIGGIVGAGCNLFFYWKKSKGLITNNPKNKDYSIPNRKYLLLASVGTQAITASPSVIITTIMGLKYASVFSIYYMVYTSLYTILNSVQLSVSAIFGNLVASDDTKKIYDAYDAISLLTFILGAVLTTCSAVLFMPFILNYTSGVTDINYIYHILPFLIVAYITLFTIEASYAYVATVYGYFKQICHITIISGILGMILSAICVALFGMPYVMVGLLVNELCNVILKCYIIKKNNKWFSISSLVRRIIFLISIVLFGCLLSNITFFQNLGWWTWIKNGIFIMLISVIITLLYCLSCENVTTRRLYSYIKHVMQRG